MREQYDANPWGWNAAGKRAVYEEIWVFAAAWCSRGGLGKRAAYEEIWVFAASWC